jgi:bacterial/archaeal transporter family protein
MSLTLALALGALACFALGDLIAKRGEDARIKPLTFLLYQSIAFLLLVLVVGFFTGAVQEVVSASWRYGLIAGLLLFTGLTAFLVSLRTSDASVTVPVFRLNFVITAILAFLFLGESVTPLKLLGLGLAVASIAVFVTKSDAEEQPSGRRGWLWLALAVVTVGITGILAKQGTSAGSAAVPLLLTQQWLIAALAVGGALIKREAAPRGKTFLYAVPSGVIQGTGTILLFEALQRGEASVAVPVVQLSFVVTAMLAVFFLREQMTKAKGIGLALAVLAVFSFAFA